MALEDYKDIVAAFAGIVTIGQIFSGVFVCKDIFKKGSTKNFPPMPFIGGFVISIVFLQHGMFLKDKTMGIVNIVGITLSIGYLVFYYAWSDPEYKSLFMRQFLKALAVIAVLIGYAQWEDPEKVRYRFGMTVTVLMMILISMPLFSLKKIIQTQSTESLPFPMILSGTVVSASWLLHGIVIKSSFVIAQNAAILIISAIQLSLFVIYPSKTSKDSSKSKVQ